MAFAIAGASGKVGRVVADRLLAQGREVIVIVRDPVKGEPWKARGAGVAVADLGDARGLARALRGTEGAWFLAPSPSDAPDVLAHIDRTGDAIAAAVAESGVPHVAFLSSIGAQLASGNGPIAGVHALEQKLRTAPASTFVRAAWFMENLAASFGTLDQGFLSTFFPVDFPIPMTASRDIGELAAKILVDGGSGSRVVEIGGPPITFLDAAAAASRVLGRPVTARQGPIEAMVAMLTGFGFSPDMARLYREMTEGFVAGRVRFEGTHPRIVASTPVDEVLRTLLQPPG